MLLRGARPKRQLLLRGGYGTETGNVALFARRYLREFPFGAFGRT
jgi:hypothetical protein